MKTVAKIGGECFSSRLPLKTVFFLASSQSNFRTKIELKEEENFTSTCQLQDQFVCKRRCLDFLKPHNNSKSYQLNPIDRHVFNGFNPIWTNERFEQENFLVLVP